VLWRIGGKDREGDCESVPYPVSEDELGDWIRFVLVRPGMEFGAIGAKSFEKD